MRRTITVASILVTSIVSIALAQSHHHGNANYGETNSTDSTFASQMMQAMDRMDSDMMAAKPTGDPDLTDFLNQRDRGYCIGMISYRLRTH